MLIAAEDADDAEDSVVVVTVRAGGLIARGAICAAVCWGVFLGEPRIVAATSSLFVDFEAPANGR